MKYKTKICPNCNKKFVTSRGNKKYCCYHCQTRYSARMYKKGLIKDEDIITMEKKSIKKNYHNNKSRWYSRQYTRVILKNGYGMIEEKCRVCGRKSEYDDEKYNLQIHHEIYPIKFNEIKKAMDSGKIYYVCKSCHNKKTRKPINRKVDYKTKILTTKQFQEIKLNTKIIDKRVVSTKNIEKEYYYKCISNKVSGVKEHFIFVYNFKNKVPNNLKRTLKELNIGNLIILDYKKEGETIMSLKAFRYSNIKGQKNKQLVKIYNKLNLDFEEQRFIRTSEKVFKENNVILKSPRPVIKEIIFSNGEGYFDLVSRPHLNFLRGLSLSVGLGKTIPTGYLLSHKNQVGREKNPIFERKVIFTQKVVKNVIKR